MSPHKPNNATSSVISSEDLSEAHTIDKYKELNDKCDRVIIRIKNRKNKKATKKQGANV